MYSDNILSLHKILILKQKEFSRQKWLKNLSRTERENCPTNYYIKSLISMFTKLSDSNNQNK